jgi:hypothetical protein
MADEVFWYGVTFTFVCPRCSEPQSELATVNSSTNDPKKINARLNTEKLACRHCRKNLPNGLQVIVHVSPGTLAQLKSAGFPIPGNLANN